ncbi:cyclic peptide export ABC transporter [Pollutimonas subterranea]|nr:cyclic peptide export ABC transporter [Pollutimonas subterranea]
MWGQQGTRGFLLAYAVLSAAAGTGILVLLNTEAELLQRQGYSTLIAVFFIVLLLVYRFSQRMLVANAAAQIEQELHARRQTIVRKTLNLSLRDIEHLRGERVVNGLAASYDSLSQAIVPLVAGLEGVVMLAFMYAYLLVLSPAAGALTAVVAGLSVLGYLSLNRQLDHTLRETEESGRRFRSYAAALVQGNKELRMNTQRRVELERDMAETSASMAASRSNNAHILAQILTTGTSVSYLLAGSVVFLLPMLADIPGEDISRIVMAVLFLIGPVGSLANSVQHFIIARFALDNIQQFEQRIDECGAPAPDATDPPPAAFDGLKLSRVCYQHQAAQTANAAGFRVDDICLELKPGEVIFITGGNGSGKTTALRVLTGLYPRDGGTITARGVQIPAQAPQWYCNLFAGVFADYHVFPRAYGLEASGLAALDHWLKRLGIRDELADDLSTLQTEALSTGQKKRLALALALAEERPVLVLDEWAADQDPATRLAFYTEILPELKRQGKAIICITHDDRYFDCADRRFHMSEGRMTPADAS